MRSLVPSATGGAFSGVLAGGNGRSPDEGQVRYYQCKIPKGIRNVTANLSLTTDPDDYVGMYRVSPDGDTLGYGQNQLQGDYLTATAYNLNPVPRLSTLIVGLRKSDRRGCGFTALHRHHLV